MKINPKFSSFNISSKGMSIQKKQMDIISENIANTSTTKTEDGSPYKRKYISVEFEKNNFSLNPRTSLQSGFRTTNPNHLSPIDHNNSFNNNIDEYNLVTKENTDNTQGDLVYMPDHPDSDEDGYVQMPNVNIVTEMVNMISASRNFEANLTAFNSAKQIAKDSLEI
jgi:flagellar basal-body rod protein FlgC